jgi:hypothetical protein
MTNATTGFGLIPGRSTTGRDERAAERLTVKEWVQIVLWAGASVSIGLAGLIAALIEAA